MERAGVPRVVHFEILAYEPERAVRFYKKVFGWKVMKWEGPVEYWLVTTGKDDEPGINGAIMRREGGGSVYNTVDVPSVDEFVEEVVMPKRAVPGVGYMAYCADTEGNVFGVMQDDPSAK